MTGMAQPRRHPSSELLLALLPIAILLSLFAYLRPVPAEDACILLRYATHLATGHGIVWNVGEDPVEGATEFAWMLMAALIIRLGAPVLGTLQALGLVFSCLGAVTLYEASRRFFRTGRGTALLVSCCYAASTTVLHAGTGFSTPLYTLLMLWSFLLACRIVDEPSGADRSGRLLALCLLALALTRPEGVLFAALLYMALMSSGLPLAWPRFLRDQALLLAAPGAVYYVWRTCYFGYPFPNTFYVKVFHGAVNPESAVRIATFVFHFCLLPLALIGVWLLTLPAPRRRRYLLLALVPLLYMACYLRFAMIQDVGFRFLFPSYAILLALAAPAFDALVAAPLRRATGAAEPGSLAGRAVAAGLAGLLLASSARMIHASDHRGVYDDRFEIGRRLARFEPASHVMMTSEAGYLPYLSDWVTLDPLGLNDETVAHAGLTESYIDSRVPDLIMFHVDTPRYSERWTPAGADRWEAMTKLMHRYAQERGYRLVAVIQKSSRPADGYHWYYVKPSAADSEAIAREILGVPGARYVEGSGE
ncbi:MAG TPA: hypothetical protein VGK94_14825 [Candidatus Polarisedimenticolia bacterium]|jgi:hypothetical protein